MEEEKLFSVSAGGCTAKLGAGVLEHILEAAEREKDPNLLVGYDSKDDASVYRLTDDLAMVQTLDFFPAGGGGSVRLENCGGECLKRHLYDGRRCGQP